ncbi:hypothetical protein CRUP_018812 [Coryphaenoides rupestris]|nr:hypothetical protein CRUP_018812 [Coryphaenoides rupestris]
MAAVTVATEEPVYTPHAAGSGSSRRRPTDSYDECPKQHQTPADDIIIHDNIHAGHPDPVDFIPPLQSTPLPPPRRMRVGPGSRSAAVAAPHILITTSTPSRPLAGGRGQWAQRFTGSPMLHRRTRQHQNKNQSSQRRRSLRNRRLSSRHSGELHCGAPSVLRVGHDDDDDNSVVVMSLPPPDTVNARQGERADSCTRRTPSREEISGAHTNAVDSKTWGSPVFAALLPSSGALLELHDPRLPASVLTHVLDYIYTGVVPSLCGQQLLYSLLDAAEYLQMDGLREALRAGRAEDGCGAVRVIHHSSELLPPASLLVGYTRLGRTPCEEPSYLGHLRYHYLPSKPSHLVDTHSHSDQADNTRPSSSPDKSSKEGEQFHGREPSAKLLFLDISSCSVQLQVFDQNGVGENGSGYGGGGGKGREGWAGAGPQALVEELCLGVRVAPGVGLSPHVGESYASTKQCDVDVYSDETRAREGQEPGGAPCDHGPDPTTLSKMEDRGYDPAVPLPTAASMPLTSPTLGKPLPSWLPADRSSPEAQQLYQCSLCERPFSQRGSLNRHVRSHLGVRPYLCPRCPMTFSRQYRVTEHMRVHERCVLREDHLKVSRSPET